MPEQQLMRCPVCGATNRVPAEKLAQGLEPVCGRCKAALRNNRPVVVTDATWGSEVEQSPVPVLVDMWAQWCGPCRLLSPVIDQLATEMGGRVRMAKLNVDENPVTTSRFAIQSIPLLLLFKGGREVDRMVGVQPKTEIARRLQKLLTT
jgi:thioredoxin 2